MRAGTPIDLKQWRKQWSHPPTPIPANATGLWYSEECVDQMLADFAKLAEGREETLRNDLASQRNCTAQLESNIQFLNERLAAATGSCNLHTAGDNTPICGTHMEQIPLNSGQCPIGGAVLLSASEERERVLREALEPIVARGEPVRAEYELWSHWQIRVREWENARAALATPAPEQPRKPGK